MQEQIQVSFSNPEDAERAASALIVNGVRKEDLTVVQHEFATSKGFTFNLVPTEHEVGDEAFKAIETELEFGPKHGAKWGLGIGAVAALATIFIPGVGIVFGVGSLSAAIGVAAIGAGVGAIAGSIAERYRAQEPEEGDGKRYEAVATEGAAIMSLALPSGDVDTPRAWEILDQFNGKPISSSKPTRTGYLA